MVLILLVQNHPLSNRGPQALTDSLPLPSYRKPGAQWGQGWTDHSPRKRVHGWLVWSHGGWRSRSWHTACVCIVPALPEGPESLPLASSPDGLFMRQFLQIDSTQRGLVRLTLSTEAGQPGSCLVCGGPFPQPPRLRVSALRHCEQAQRAGLAEGDPVWTGVFVQRRQLCLTGQVQPGETEIQCMLSFTPPDRLQIPLCSLGGSRGRQGVGSGVHKTQQL